MWDKTNGQYIKKGMDAMNSFDPNGHARKKETKLTNNSIQNRRVCVFSCITIEYKMIQSNKTSSLSSSSNVKEFPM